MVLTAPELAQKLYGVHQIGAMMTGVPEIAIQDVEARALADAIVELNQYYDLVLLSGKYAAIIGFASVCGMIYIPRVGAVMRRGRKAKQQPQGLSPADMFRQESEVHDVAA